MKLSSKIINKNQLCKIVSEYSGSYSNLIACALLIAHEFSSATKVQFNIMSPKGSLHIEYRDRAITYYKRYNFEEESDCTLSVSIVQSIGYSYSSLVNGESAVDCFREYLKLSDQRKGKFLLDKKQVKKIEYLPSTKFVERNVRLEELEFQVVEIES